MCDQWRCSTHSHPLLAVFTPLRTPLRRIEPTAMPVVHSNYLTFCRIKPWVGSGALRRGTNETSSNNMARLPEQLPQSAVTWDR